MTSTNTILHTLVNASRPINIRSIAAENNTLSIAAVLTELLRLRSLNLVSKIGSGIALMWYWKAA